MNKLFCASLLLISLFLISSGGRAQSYFSLYEVVKKAKYESPAALRAETQKENRYWQYRTYLSAYKPQLVLDGFNDYTWSVRPVEQNDGSIIYTDIGRNRANLGLNLQQRIGITNTSIRLRSGIERTDNFLDNYYQYQGDPVNIEIVQPLFSFNPLLWDRRIEPLRYQESQKEYIEELEEIAVTATNLFFDLLLAQASLEIAQKNLGNNDTIYKIAEGRYNLGKVSEGELLQLELTLMRAQQQVAQAKLDMETSALRLKSYIGLNNSENIVLIPPAEIPDIEVDVELALQEALKNRQGAIAFKRMRLEAEREVARARGETGFDAQIVGSYGLTNSGQQIPEVYQDPINQQGVFLEFNLPLVDWGRQKSRIKTAEANKQLVEYTVAQDQINFEQEIYTQVRLFEMLRLQAEIAEKSDDIAQRRYELAKNRYLIGKVSITDLNIATQEKDEARRAYVAAMDEYWTAYYTLRQLTLYDFEQNIPIIPD